MAVLNPIASLLIMFAATTLVLTSAHNPIVKREIPLYGDVMPSFAAALSPLAKYGSGYSLGSWSNLPKPPSPSPTEVANAIAVAKQASANVVIAQQQVQAAKDHIFSQQKIAMDRETAAMLLTQKSEAAAAIQRSEAAAAAQAVILAQQRLAAAKGTVAHQQRIASAKEAEAAIALQRAAYAAAVEIQRTENEAAKYSNLQRMGTSAAAHHLAATKDAALAPLTSGNNHVPSLALTWPDLTGPILPPNSWSSSGPLTATAFLTPPKAALPPFWK